MRGYFRHAGLRTISGGNWLGLILDASLRRALLQLGYHSMVLSESLVLFKQDLSHFNSVIYVFSQSKIMLFGIEYCIDPEQVPLNHPSKKDFSLPIPAAICKSLSTIAFLNAKHAVYGTVCDFVPAGK